MATLHEARLAVADAVTVAGIPCTPYSEDNVSLPAAFVDTATVSYEGQLYCRSRATLTLVTAAQRHDRPGAVRHLEDAIVAVVAALADLDARVESVSSGSVAIQGQDVPACLYTIDLYLE